MATLTNEQKQFLEKQQVPLSRVFDASGLSPSTYRKIMSDLGMLIAIGVAPCKLSGHRMRTRAGHCVQCDTSKLAYLQRYDDDGHVYVATSIRAGLTKIGTANDASSRINTLNSHGYGGVNDWRLHQSFQCEKAGRIEFFAQSKLRSSRVGRKYIKNGMEVECQELFSCDVKIAIESVIDAIRQLQHKHANPTEALVTTRDSSSVRLDVAKKPNASKFTTPTKKSNSETSSDSEDESWFTNLDNDQKRLLKRIAQAGQLRLAHAVVVYFQKLRAESGNREYQEALRQTKEAGPSRYSEKRHQMRSPASAAHKALSFKLQAAYHFFEQLENVKNPIPKDSFRGHLGL